MVTSSRARALRDKIDKNPAVLDAEGLEQAPDVSHRAVFRP